MLAQGSQVLVTAFPNLPSGQVAMQVEPSLKVPGWQVRQLVDIAPSQVRQVLWQRAQVPPLLKLSEGQVLRQDESNCLMKLGIQLMHCVAAAPLQTAQLAWQAVQSLAAVSKKVAPEQGGAQ